MAACAGHADMHMCWWTWHASVWHAWRASAPVLVMRLCIPAGMHAVHPHLLVMQMCIHAGRRGMHHSGMLHVCLHVLIVQTCIHAGRCGMHQSGMLRMRQHLCWSCS